MCPDQASVCADPTDFSCYPQDAEGDLQGGVVVHSSGPVNSVAPDDMIVWLWKCYHQSGDLTLLDKAIALEESVLDSIPESDPKRPIACEDLAISLWQRYAQTRDVSVLNKVVRLRTEAHALCPLEHVHRDTICTRFSLTLFELYQHTGDVALITLVSKIEREVLSLRPYSHNERADSCTNLAVCLKILHSHTGDVKLFDEAIELELEALDLRPCDHPERIIALSNLGSSYHKRYLLTKDSDLLDKAITMLRESRSLTPAGDPMRTALNVNLALSLRDRYGQTSNLDLLAEAIELGREAVDIVPSEHPDRAAVCDHLAMSLKMQYEQTGEVALLGQATSLLREALEMRSPQHPDRAMTCGNLAVVLKTRYAKSGDRALLEEATGLEREAHALHRPGHVDRAKACVNLAHSLKTQYRYSGEVRLLENAIELEREALTAGAATRASRVHTLENLAVSLKIRYEQTGDFALLTETISFEREAMALCPRGHTKYAGLCSNLAVSLQLCYEQTGQVTLLDEATELQHAALTSRGPDHPARASSCVNLALTLKMRYEQTGDDALLSGAIKLEREALALHALGHPDRVTSCKNLAVSLKMHHARTGAADVLDEAIALEREVLALRPPHDPGHAPSCTNLAISLRLRYKQTHDARLLDEAVELERQALAARPVGHHDRVKACVDLALSLQTCYAQTGDVSLIDEAAKLYSEAAQYSPTASVWRAVIGLCQLSLIQHSTTGDDLSRAIEHLHTCSLSEADNIRALMTNVSFTLAKLWQLRETWTPNTGPSLIPIYSNIIDRLPLMATFVLNTASRLVALRFFSQLGSQACVVALEAGRISQAIELLDHAHGVVWTQALHQRDPQLADAPPAVASELENLLRAITVSVGSELTDSHLASQGVRHVQNSRIQTLLGEIRAMPGLNRFMRGSTFETLRQAARDHPVVVLVAADGECYAVTISITAKEPHAMKLGVSSAQIVELQGRTRQAGYRMRASSEDGGTDVSSEHDEEADHPAERVMRPGGPQYSLTGVLRVLWKVIVKPVLNQLGLRKAKGGKRPRLHWCPTGHFASLPVHAAGIYTGTDRECCSDYVVTSYTPTLTSLLRAQRARAPVPVHDVKLVLLPASPTSSGRFTALPKVETEVNLVADIASRAKARPKILSADKAKTKKIAKALEAASIVHLACHGTQDAGSPLQSAFHLSGKRRLAVSDLMELDLKHAHLAFLSACETAKGDREQPDQAIHLAATMLFLGFRSVVGTMWAMNDDDGPTIARAFYEKLFEGQTIDPDAVARALDHAVQKLRDGGAPPERWATFMHVGA